MAFRAFVALPVPPDPALAALVADLHGPEVKTTDPDHLHLTLSFLGDVPDGSEARLSAALDGSVRGLAPFGLRLHGVGAFPNERKPRVLWAGIREEPRLAELAARVRAALPPDDAKPFRAHLTLGRVREGACAERATAWLRRHAEDALPDVPVREVRLYRSILHGARGAVHEVVHAARLEA